MKEQQEDQPYSSTRESNLCRLERNKQIGQKFLWRVCSCWRSPNHRIASRPYSVQIPDQVWVEWIKRMNVAETQILAKTRYDESVVKTESWSVITRIKRTLFILSTFE